MNNQSENESGLSFQIASDLHIEFEPMDQIDVNEYVTRVAPILVLAGDVGSLYRPKQLEWFLKGVSIIFDRVLYIPGNHEYYIRDKIKPLPIHKLNKRLYNIGNRIPNLTILNRSHIIIGDVCFAGAVLWTEPLEQIPKRIVRIYRFGTKEFHQSHINDLQFIKAGAEYCMRENLKYVIVTHYPPSPKVLLNEKFRKPKYVNIYVNYLDSLIESMKWNYWVAGHVHINFDIEIPMSDGQLTNRRLVGNQYGKPKFKVNGYRKDFLLNV